MRDFPERYNEDDLLNLTQHTRKLLLESMVKGGMPEDNSSIRVLTELMTSMDSTSLAMKKLDQDGENASANRQAAMIAMQLFSKTGTTNPFENECNTLSFEEQTGLNDGDIQDVVVVEGELDIGISDLTYEEFIAKNAL